MALSGETLRKILPRLPEHLQELILTPETGETIVSIMEKGGLTEFQKNTLGEEITRVLFGLRTADDFKKNIATELGVSADIGKQTVDDLEHMLFSKAQRDLSEIAGKFGGETKPSQTSPRGVGVPPQPTPSHPTQGAQSTSTAPSSIQSPPRAPEGLVIMPQPTHAQAKPPSPPPAPPRPERAELPRVSKPEWKPEEHLITPHPSLPGERPSDVKKTFAAASSPQKPPASIFEQKVSDFYKAPKENGGSGDIKDPYREPTI